MSKRRTAKVRCPFCWTPVEVIMISVPGRDDEPVGRAGSTHSVLARHEYLDARCRGTATSAKGLKCV